ncbi:MAG: hypothetical protein A2076_09865 [Geobacteraceae bacterium GWC2_53_11]|nr:MAG: hypothetical protein A2076_09865 [Geobacteraceae bacterium GWC2_53_11]
MKKNAGLWKYLLSLVLLLSVFSTAALAFDISGTVTSTHAKTVYLSIRTQNGNFGTSIASAPGIFTIQGVPAGNYVVTAFEDVLDTGSRHASDPSGVSSSISVTANTGGVNVALTTPTVSTVPAPNGLIVLPSDNSALVMWNSINNGQGELADKYGLFWSTSSDVVGTYATQGGSLINIPATGDMRGLILTDLTTVSSGTPIANGATLYFAVTAKIGANESLPATHANSVFIGSALGGYSVSGTVTFTGSTLGKPLLLAVVDNNQNGPPSQIYMTKVVSPVSPQSYTVSSVPNGTYRVYAFFDLNGNSLMDAGDLDVSDAVAPVVTVANGPATNADITLSSALESAASVRTNHWKDDFNESYGLNFEIEGKYKRPVKVTLITGSNVTGPLDIALDDYGRFNSWAGIASVVPQINDTYTFNVTYSDLSIGTITGSVTGVLNSFATPVSPVGATAFNATPALTWSAPASPPAGFYGYQVSLEQQNGGGIFWDPKEMSSAATSVNFNFDGSASQTALTDNTAYNWKVSVFDASGNSATQQASFTYGTTGDSQAPSVPSGVTAAGVNSNQINVTWNAATDNVGVNYYTIYRNGSIFDQLFGATNTSLSDTTVTTGVPYNYTVVACDAAGNCSASSTPVTATATATSPLAISTTSLPNGVAGYAYSQQINATGGIPPYTFSIATGSIPGGLTLSSTGVLSGTVSNTATGNYAFTVQVTDSVSATAQGTLNIAVDTAFPAISSAGVYHGTLSSGVEADSLDMLVKNATALSPTTNVTATVTGPNGFNYSFTNADIKPFINGQIDLNYQLPTALTPGVYTFTLDDGQGHVSKRVDTHGGVATVPVVDSTKIQFQRKSDGSYRLSWASLNDTKTYNYRVRINDGTGAPVYFSNRTMQGFDDVPAASLVVGTTYQVRVEASESATFDMMTNRSSSSYVPFTPQVSDNAGMLLYSYAGAFNQVEADGTQGANFGFAACNSTGTACSASDASLVTLAEIYAPDGSLYYTYDLVADKQSNGVDFLHFFNPAPAAGNYKIRFVANGLDHFSYVTLTTPVVYPAPDNSTYQAIEQSNGNIRFSWANVDYNGALYYRIQIKDMVTGTYYTTGRLNQTIIDVPSSTLGSVFGNSTNVKWRVEVYDSSNYNTQRNRRNGLWSVGVLSDTPPYSAVLPTIGNYGIANAVPSNGIASTEIWFAASSTSATITELRVEGPNGFTRNMMTQASNVGNGQYRLYESGSLQSGLYKFTAFDSNGNNSFRYDYLTSPHALPVVDMKTIQVTTDPNGDMRFSWAPVISDITTWCNLLVFTNTDIYGTGTPDLLVTSSLIQASSVAFTSATLAPSQLMLRVQCNDGSNTMVYSNRSRSMMVGYHGTGYNYSTLTDADGDGYASDVDVNDNDANVYPFSLIGGTTDTIPPTVPANVTTIAVSASQVDVSWSSSTDNVGVTSYKVFRDGNLVAQPSGATNTFWSDTTVAAMTTYSYSVAACDAANNCSAQSSPITVTTPSSVTPTGPVTFTGTISYSGTKTGYVHVSVQTNNGTLGTAIKWTTGMTSANYTIRGVPSGNVSNTITAYLDSQDTGFRTASSPVGSSSGSTATARDITLNAPAQVAPGAPQNVEVKPGDSAVLMAWQPNTVNNVIDADYYDIYWDTTAQVSTSSAGKKLSIPAGLDSPITISSLTNGTNYYFMVVPRTGTLTGTASAVVGPITVGARTGLNTVSGTVTYNGTIPVGTPLLIAVAGTGSDKGIGSVHFASIANATASQAFSVSGIPDGGYEVYVILDLNKDGIIGNGDISNTSNDQAPIINLSGGAGTAMGTIALVSKNSTVSVTTDHFKSGTDEWFNVNGSVTGQLKRPVSVTLDTAPSSSTQFYVPMDLTIGNDNGKDIQFWGGNNVAPVVGDTYSFTIRYSDGTTETGVTAAITGVINNYPVNPTISSPVSTVPTFSWSAPTVAPAGNYQYSLWVDNATNNNKMWEQWSIPSSIRSITYGSGSSSSSTLLVGTAYKWSVSVRDQNGNKATTGSNFTPTTSGTAGDTTAPALVSTVPANNATGVSINAAISITFSEAIKGMPDLTAALKNNTTNQYVQGFGSSTADSKTHTFVPSAPLAPGTTYSIQFSTVTDMVGNALPVTTLTFTTETTDATAPVTTASPAGGLYNANQTVTLNANETATIYYTTNGATPSVSSTVYSAPISISADTTLKFFAKDTAGNVETVKTQAYTIDKIAPVTTSSRAAGTYGASFDVTLAANETATIYYTTNGSDPTTSSSAYSTPILISANTTLKFFARDTAGNSETIKTAVYVIDTSLPVTTVSPVGGLYNSAQSVTLSASEAGASIYYTVNGATPTASSTKYTAAITISATTTLKFFAKDSAGNSEAVRTETYTIDTVKPAVTATSPSAGATGVAYDSTVTVTFSEALKESTISSTSIQVSTATAPIAGSITYSPGTKIATFTPAALLPSGAVIYLSVANVEDLAGNKVTALNRSFTTALPDGDYNADGIFTIADVNEILKASLMRSTPSAAQLKRIDIAPLVGGKPSPDGVVDVSDVVVALRKLVGLVSW